MCKRGRSWRTIARTLGCSARTMVPHHRPLSPKGFAQPDGRLPVGGIRGGGRCFFRRRFKPIPHPRLSVDVTGVVRVPLELLAQLVDKNTQIFRLVAIIRPPNRLQDPAVAETFSPVCDEVSEQVEFLLCQVN